MRDFGYFVTESSEHLSEYVPWLIKNDRADLIDRYSIPLDEYPARCVDQIADWSSMRAALLSDDPQAIDAYQSAKGESLSGNWERKLARERLAIRRAKHVFAPACSKNDTPIKPAIPVNTAPSSSMP